MTIVCIIFAALFGAVFGSFLNMLIYRLPNKVPLWATKKNWEANHSRCPKCGYFLNWQDLFPIVSYVWLKGRCRYCHAPIGARYVWVEVVCAALGVVVYVVVT
jgi:leader peptidase (prepilin peptidase) / N-methyltransferase